MIVKHFSIQSIVGLPALFVCALAFEVVDAQAENNPDLTDARVVETGVLQSVPGFTGDVLGAEVIAITPGENDTQVIDIVIPVDPDKVDRIRVMTADGKPLKQKEAVEFSRDHENGELGITLKLNKKQKLGFKFKLIDLPDDQ
jgi:hypothetical protein